MPLEPSLPSLWSHAGAGAARRGRVNAPTPPSPSGRPGQARSLWSSTAGASLAGQALARPLVGNEERAGAAHLSARRRRTGRTHLPIRMEAGASVVALRKKHGMATHAARRQWEGVQPSLATPPTTTRTGFKSGAWPAVVRGDDVGAGQSQRQSQAQPEATARTFAIRRSLARPQGSREVPHLGNCLRCLREGNDCTTALRPGAVGCISFGDTVQQLCIGNPALADHRTRLRGRRGRGSPSVTFMSARGDWGGGAARPPYASVEAAKFRERQARAATLAGIDVPAAISKSFRLCFRRRTASQSDPGRASRPFCSAQPLCPWPEGWVGNSELPVVIGLAPLPAHGKEVA